MQNRHTIHVILLFFCLLNFNLVGLSQKLVTYKAENQPLNAVLSKISATTKVRFAFDDDYFSKINVTFKFEKLPVDEFLKQLCLKYPIAYKLIGQTWVVYKDEKKVVERPKPKVQVVKAIPPPVIKKKIEYKKARLWDLTGTIIDVKSGNRLKFCQFFVNEFTKPTTNPFGFFSDEVVGLGDVRIKCNPIGFYPLDTVIQLFDEKEIVLKLNPIWKVEKSNIDSYLGIFQMKMADFSDMVELYPHSANYIPGMNSTDFANTTKLIAGIHFAEGSDGGLTIRGSAPAESVVLMDGIPVSNSGLLCGQLSTQNSKFIQQAFISRGGFGAEFGGSSSGIFDLIGKSGQGHSVVDFTASMLDANLFVGIPLTHKISISTSIRKSIVDYWPNYYYKNLAYSSTILKTIGSKSEDGKVINSLNNYFDLNFKLSYQPNISNEIDFIFSSSFDKQNRSFDILKSKNYFMNSQSDRQNYGLGLNWKFRSKNLWNNTIVASYSSLSHQDGLEFGRSISDEGSTGYIRSDNDLNNSSEILLKWKSEFSYKKFSHQFGAEFNYYHLNYKYNYYVGQSFQLPQYTIDSIINDNNKELVNLFYQGKYKLTNKIELIAGVRGFVDLSLAEIFVQPRAGIDYKPNESMKFYYRFGHYIQPFYQAHRYGIDLNPVSVWILPTQSNQFIRSNHHIAGGNFHYKGFLINLEGYMISSTGKAAYFTERFVNDLTIGELYELHTSSTIRNGVDATIQFHHNIFNHSLAYSISDNNERHNKINNNRNYPSFANHRHQLQLTETMAFSGWIASASFMYFSGTPYLQQGSTIEKFDYSQLSSFSQLDLSLVRQFSLSSLKFEAGAVLLNVLGTKNEKKIEFFQLGEKENNEVIQSTTIGIPFTPTFFINLKFD